MVSVAVQPGREIGVRLGGGAWRCGPRGLAHHLVEDPVQLGPLPALPRRGGGQGVGGGSDRLFMCVHGVPRICWMRTSIAVGP